MSRYYNRRRGSSAPRVARWLQVKYAGTCKVCGRVIAVGESAYWDPHGARETSSWLENGRDYAAVTRDVSTLTCHDHDCIIADGLGQMVSPFPGVTRLEVFAFDRGGARVGPGYVRDPGEDMADRWLEVQP